MDTAHLDALPEVRANFSFDLADGEKVIFAASLSCFGTEEDTFLGGGQSKLCLTNRRLVANNTVGLWTVDLADDVVGAALDEPCADSAAGIGCLITKKDAWAAFQPVWT